MPPSVDSPVKTRFPLPVPDGVMGSGRSMCSKPPACRRIFVQTETGSVLGIELDQTDNVQTVKKKMQTLLNVPTEQTNLVFGSTVLKSDLSEVRNDSPLLLTRELQRSLSTPCFFHPSDMHVPMDSGVPFEVVGGLRCCLRMKRIIKDVVKALECGVEPIAVRGGLGGAYYFRNCRGESVAVVKPTDEEPFAPNNPKGFVGKTLGQPGLKRAVRVGETGVREVAAYLLDHDHFASVPPTVLVKVSHGVFNVNTDTSVRKDSGRGSSPVAKLASCQQFVPHDYDASDHGTSRFSVSSVHRIGILDVRIFNTDRHAGNILIRKSRPKDSQGAWGHSNFYVNETLELIPIDHGLCLPEGLEDTYFEWLHWPQASVPFSEEELDYIQKLDAAKDVEMLHAHLPMLREACHRMLILSTTVLKKAAAAGLCLAEIGEMMTRDEIEDRSHIELLCLQAKRESLGCAFEDDDALSDLSLGETNEELLEQFEFDLDENNGDADASDCGEGLSVPLLTLPNRSFWSSLSRNGQDVLLKAPLKSIASDEDEDVIPAGNLTPNGRASLFRRLSGESPRSFRLSGSSHTVSSPKGKASFYSPEKDASKPVSENKLKTSISAGKSRLESPRAMPYRSVSFNYHKQRYGNHSDRQDPFKDVPLTPAPKLRGNAYTNANTNQLSLGEMSGEEWISFMAVFNELLEQALTARCTQKVSHRQRLGTSCQF